MAPAQKRKTVQADEAEEGTAKRRFVEAEEETLDDANPATGANIPTPEDSNRAEAASNPTSPDDTEEAQTSSSSSSNLQSDRLARFKALQARQSASRKQNMKESQAEAQRAAVDPSALNSLQRKHAVAAHKLLKAETADAGEDFERKRAWDWTVEESEKWDKRMNKRERHQGNVAFADFGREAGKVYKRQINRMNGPDLEGYEQEKMARIERAAKEGGLEVIETESGELIAVDRDGSFLSTGGEGPSALHGKPSKEAVDRLVADIKKAEEVRMEKRKRRMREDGMDDGGDVTYINVKNKQFNDKLKRFYDKYTGDIRESFERGTAM